MTKHKVPKDLGTVAEMLSNDATQRTIWQCSLKSFVSSVSLIPDPYGSVPDKVHYKPFHDLLKNYIMQGVSWTSSRAAIHYKFSLHVYGIINTKTNKMQPDTGSIQIHIEFNGSCYYLPRT
jgi:hypothetical protein